MISSQIGLRRVSDSPLLRLAELMLHLGSLSEEFDFLRLLLHQPVRKDLELTPYKAH